MFYRVIKQIVQKFRFKRKKEGEPIFTLSDTVHVSSDLIIGTFRSIQLSSGVKLKIEPGVVFREFCNLLVYANGCLHIGSNVFFNNYCSINCLYNIQIGENTLFGEGVKIYDHNHTYAYDQPTLHVERNEFTTAAVKIGKNCWIGSNVTILKGVTIGDNVIIGAGNLIYKSVPSNKIVKLKSEAIIEDL